MTLQELNEHFQLREQLAKAKEMLTSLRRAAVPRAQVITGMPHVSGVSDKVGNLAVEIADLESSIQCIQQTIKLEEDTITEFISSIPDNQVRMVFRLRFLHGLTWDDVAAVVGGRNTVSGVKKTCYRYLETSGRTRKTEVKK